MNSIMGSHGGVDDFGSIEAVQRHRVWFIGLGIVLFILGVLAIAVPFIASMATALFVGWLLIISGIGNGIHAFQNRRWAGFPWALLSSILSIVTGVLIVINPLVGTLTLTLILATFFLINGFVRIVRAFQHRAMEGWAWLLVDGIVSMGLGVLIWARWPSTALWALGLLVGIDLAVSGVSMLMLGLLRPRAVRRAVA